MHSVSVITINYNHSHITEEMLASISLSNKHYKLEIIVVDNGSKENPIPNWRLTYPIVKFIRSEVNLGYAGGNNLGIKEASGDYLFLVNNDTEFTEDLVEQMLITMNKHPQIGILSPKIRYYHEPELLQYAGFTEMNYFTARNECVGQYETDTGQYDNLTGKTAFAHGAAMMIKKEAIEKVGLMPENFFLYYEEMDWCEQFKKLGYEIWVDMQAMIFHKESVSVGKNSRLKVFFMNRNRILFIRRNAPFYKLGIFYLYFLLIVTPRNIATYIRDKNLSYISVLLSAIWWNITNPVTSTRLGFSIHKI